MPGWAEIIFVPDTHSVLGPVGPLLLPDRLEAFMQELARERRHRTLERIAFFPRVAGSYLTAEEIAAYAAGKK